MTSTTAPARAAPDPTRIHHGVTDVDPGLLDDTDFAFWVTLHDPALTRGPGRGPASALVHSGTASALVTPGDGAWVVRQRGGRPWDTVETASRSFVREGRPARTRIVLRVQPDGGQFFSLAGDDGRNRWPLPDTAEA